MKRSIRIDVYPSKEIKQVVLNEIRLYRAVCRKAFSACALAEMAGAEISSKIISSPDGDTPVEQLVVKPNPQAKEILGLAYQVTGKAHLYELRKWIRDFHPSWMSIVPESIHRDIVSSRWRAKDPEFPKATRGYLTLNGARAFAKFNHVGIYFKNTAFTLNPSARDVMLKWDLDIGPVEFKVNKLDPYRYSTWKSISTRQDGWKAGGVYLNERDGKIFLTVSYECPDPKAEIDNSRNLTVTFTGSAKEYIHIIGEKKTRAKTISSIDAVALMEQLAIVKKRIEQQMVAASICRRHRKAVAKKLASVTRRRTEAEKDFNHVWSRIIVNEAVRKKCGTIILVNQPKEELSSSIPWSWYQFESFLKYKISEIGGELKTATLDGA